MRRLCLFLCLISTAAHAGTIATYARPDGGDTIVEVADNGDARIGQADDGEYGLLIDGRFYMVEVAQETTSMRLEDIAAAAGLALPREFGKLLSSPGAGSTTASNLEADGRATVSGRTGKRFRMIGSASPNRLVVSDDPALRWRSVSLAWRPAAAPTILRVS